MLLITVLECNELSSVVCTQPGVLEGNRTVLGNAELERLA
jgi:hypothetical protein